MLLLILCFLGLFTYVVLKRSVVSLTRTPLWLLWLVMMLPAFTLVIWAVVNGPEEPAPASLLLVLLLGCPLLYWVLLEAGRIAKPPARPGTHGTDGPTSDASPAPPVPLTPKPVLRPIDKDEEQVLQSCFPWSVYYLQTIEYRPQGMICKGQLRTSPAVAYETVCRNVHDRFGDRFLVIFQDGPQGKPVFTLLPTSEREDKRPLARPVLALGLLGATLFTTTAAGAAMAGIGQEQLQEQPALIWSGLPYALALLLILGCHEMGHYLAARHYRMRVTLPYFIPVPFFLGTLGAFIQIKSPVPHRRALFDVGLAGPLSGLVVAVPLLLWGLGQSTTVPAPDEASLLNFQALDPTASLLLALAVKLALGAQIEVGQAVSLHPVAVAGCLGLVVTALNLMPVGQLDGGHIVHAMYGQRTGAIIGQIARLLVLGLVAVHSELLLWAILLFFIPAVDEPALNDVSELDDRRDIAGLLALTILVMIVLPAPGMVIRLLY